MAGRVAVTPEWHVGMAGNGIVVGGEGHHITKTTKSKWSTVMAVSSYEGEGRYYWEYTVQRTTYRYIMFGVCPHDFDFTVPGRPSFCYYLCNGNKFINGSWSPFGTRGQQGDTIGVHLDLFINAMVIFKNNERQGTIMLPPGGRWHPCVGLYDVNDEVTTVHLEAVPRGVWCGDEVSQRLLRAACGSLVDRVRYVSVEWDVQRSGPMLQTDMNGRRVVSSKSGEMQTAVGREVFGGGDVVHWAVKIEEMTSGNIVMGVCDEGQDMTVGDICPPYGYGVLTGERYVEGVVRSVMGGGVGVRGDEIGMVFEDGMLMVMKNNIRVGSVRLPLGRRWRPCVGLQTEGDIVMSLLS